MHWINIGDKLEGEYLGYELINHSKPFNAFNLRDEKGEIWSVG